jgi:hypothetical protein
LPTRWPPPLWVGQDTSASSNNRTVGQVLVIVGLAGVVPLATFAVRDVNPRRTMEA